MYPYAHPNRKIAMQSYFTGLDPKKIAADKSAQGASAATSESPSLSPVANTELAFDTAVQNVRNARGISQTAGALAGGAVKTVYGAAQDALTLPARGIAATGQGIYDFGNAAINGVQPLVMVQPPQKIAEAAIDQRNTAQRFPSSVPRQSVVQPTMQSAAPSGADAETAAINKLSGSIASPITAAGNDFVARGNSGLRALSTNPGALKDFNDLQGVRGNGINATRDANGQLTFSNNPNAQPKLPVGTQGFDLAGANQRMQASLANNANIDRDKTIADLAGSIAATSGKKRNALVQQYNDLLRVKDQQGSAIADVGYKTAQTGLAQTQNEAAQGSLTQQRKLQALQDRYLAETDPAKQKALGEQILTLLGKDPKENKFQIATQEDPIDPANPMMGMRRVPYLIDAQGRVQRLDQMTGGAAQVQPVEGKIYVDGQGNKAKYVNGKYVPV